jgi:hypothetical protein
MPGEGFISQMISSLKNNTSLRKNIRHYFQDRKFNGIRNHAEIETGPSNEAWKQHLKELRHNERSENIKAGIILIAFLILIIAAVIGVIESLN